LPTPLCLGALSHPACLSRLISMRPRRHPKLPGWMSGRWMEAHEEMARQQRGAVFATQTR
jgi:hypothetical protein